MKHAILILACPICENKFEKKVFNQKTCGSWNCKKEASKVRSQESRDMKKRLKIK